MKEEMCGGCMACNGSDYTIEVDADFLLMIHQALQNLAEHAPDYSASGWIKRVESYIDEIQKKYKQPIDIFGKFYKS